MKRIFFASGLITIIMILILFIEIGNPATVQKVHAATKYVAAEDLKIETGTSATKPFTTFAGGKYLHLDPIDKNHKTNNISSNADMEYDENTGVLKVFETDNTRYQFTRLISIIATNDYEANLTIELYYSISLYVLDFENGNLILKSGEGCHNPKISWVNKLSITGKLTISGEIDCLLSPTSVTGTNSELTSWLKANELALLDSASLEIYNTFNNYNCALNVGYLTLNTDGVLRISTNRTKVEIVLRVEYEVNFIKCLRIQLSSPLGTALSLTNSTYLRNMVSSNPDGYSVSIDDVAISGEYDDYGYQKYGKEFNLKKLFDVSYNGNGGTGTMNGDKVPYADEFTLGTCTFTAPTGKQFVGWAVGDVNKTPLRQANYEITITEPTVIYAIWEDVPREFTSQPSNATKQISQEYTANWTVNFDVVEYAVCFWNGANWQEFYHYDAQTISAGTQMSYIITSDEVGDKKYTIDCYYDEFHCLTSNEFVISWEAIPAAELTGTVLINGSFKFGETLTANVTDTNNTGTLSYQWRRNGSEIAGATNSTYVLVEDDIGYTLSVVIKSSVESGGLCETASGVVEKADGAIVPNAITATSCTTEANNDGSIIGVTTLMEYKLNTSELWLDVEDTTITGLINGTYNVRYKETNTHNAGQTYNVVVNAYNAPVQYAITVLYGTASSISAEAGETIAITANAPEEGYKFVSWTSSDVEFVNANSMETSFIMPAKAVNITATYQLSNFTITFNANGGSGTQAPVEVGYGLYNLPENPFTAPDGKEFDGWSLSSDGEKITTSTINVTEDATLFAMWKDVEIEIEPQPEKNNGLSAGAIVAIVLASVVVVSVGGFAIYWFVIQKKTWSDFVALFKKK